MALTFNIKIYNCKGCSYWFPIEDTMKGECRRFPPKVEGDRIICPITEADFGCGENDLMNAFPKPVIVVKEDKGK